MVGITPHSRSPTAGLLDQYSSLELYSLVLWCVGFVNESFRNQGHLKPGYDHCCLRAVTRSFWSGSNASPSRLPDCFCAESVLLAARGLFPWLQVKPSTPVAASSVVIMCNTKEGKRWTNCCKSVSREGLSLCARLALGSLSEDSSVT